MGKNTQSWRLSVSTTHSRGKHPKWPVRETNRQWDSQKREWKNAPAAPKTWGRQPSLWHYKNDLPSMGKMKPQPKTWKEKHTGNSSCSPKREKTQKRECIAEWHTILGLFLAQEVRTRFSKNGSLPNSKLVAHTLPLPCNNCLNHQQSFFNESGWVKTRRSHMGIFPYWLKLDNFPTSLPLEDHAPFDLVAAAVAGCVHFN